MNMVLSCAYFFGLSFPHKLRGDSQVAHFSLCSASACWGETGWLVVNFLVHLMASNGSKAVWWSLCLASKDGPSNHDFLVAGFFGTHSTGVLQSTVADELRMFLVPMVDFNNSILDGAVRRLRSFPSKWHFIGLFEYCFSKSRQLLEIQWTSND